MGNIFTKLSRLSKYRRERTVDTGIAPSVTCTRTRKIPGSARTLAPADRGELCYAAPRPRTGRYLYYQQQEINLAAIATIKKNKTKTKSSQLYARRAGPGRLNVIAYTHV